MLTRGVERNVGCHVRELIAMPGRGLMALKSRDRREQPNTDVGPVMSLIGPYPEKRDTIKAPLSHFQGSAYAKVSPKIEGPSAPLTPSRALKVRTFRTGSYEPLLKMRLPIDLSGHEVPIPSILRALSKGAHLELAFVKGYLLKPRLKNPLTRAHVIRSYWSPQSRPASRARCCLMRHLRTLGRARACRLCRLMARLMAIDRRA